MSSVYSSSLPHIYSSTPSSSAAFGPKTRFNFPFKRRSCPSISLSLAFSLLGASFLAIYFFHAARRQPDITSLTSLTSDPLLSLNSPSNQAPDSPSNPISPVSPASPERPNARPNLPASLEAGETPLRLASPERVPPITPPPAAADAQSSDTVAVRAQRWLEKVGDGSGRAAEDGMRAPHAAPAWCPELVHAPRTMLAGSTCHRTSAQDLCSDGGPAYFSELNHDYFLYENHFQFLTRSGVYLDLAANHAREISNTYFFDTCLGWRGFCVEANSRYFEELREARTCELLTQCVSDKVETVKFVKYLGLSGIEDTNKNMKRFKDEPWMRARVREEEMTCAVLGEEVNKREYLRKIDYMSLDVEGHEAKLLNSIDWNTTSISVVSLEVGEDKSASDFLLAKGYTKMDIPRCKSPRGQDDKCIADEDEIFLAPGVVFGKP